MKERLGFIVTIVIAIVVLATINSLAFLNEEPQEDSELSPNRSSYHAGPTGTRALYDFLSESGYKVMRWRETPDRLLSKSGERVKTFVIVGDTRVGVEPEEAQSLLAWTQRGGTLVIIDRRPEPYLLPPSGDWRVTVDYLTFPTFEANPGDAGKMTEDVKALQPVQPTALTHDVELVMPSRFFSAIKVWTAKNEANAGDGGIKAEDNEDLVSNTGDESTESPAPVAHLKSGPSAQLIDYPHGKGRIVLLSDPFIVANGGIALKDNLQLARNLLSTTDGVIAFDEFHQGRGIARNAFIGYFSGTPILAICGQIALLVLLIIWTRGRRFGRPLPLPKVDRRSSLEFVASMAELQQRARAFDLAIENVYARARRVLARYAGVDYNSARSVIAERVASRSSLEAHQLETLMRQSEEVINGGEVSERQSIQIVKRLREVENSLGLRMRSREVKQTAQKI